MTVAMFGYLTLHVINIDFYDFISLFFSLALVLTERICQTLMTVFTKFPSTSNFVQNTPLRVVFFALFSMFRNAANMFFRV